MRASVFASPAVQVPQISPAQRAWFAFARRRLRCRLVASVRSSSTQGGISWCPFPRPKSALLTSMQSRGWPQSTSRRGSPVTVQIPRFGTRDSRRATSAPSRSTPCDRRAAAGFTGQPDRLRYSGSARIGPLQAGELFWNRVAFAVIDVCRYEGVSGRPRPRMPWLAAACSLTYRGQPRSSGSGGGRSGPVGIASPATNALTASRQMRSSSPGGSVPRSSISASPSHMASK